MKYTKRVIKHPLFYGSNYRRKGKKEYQGDDAEQVIIEYHDKVTAGNGELLREDHPLGTAADLPALMVRINRIIIGMDEYFP